MIDKDKDKDKDTTARPSTPPKAKRGPRLVSPEDLGIERDAPDPKVWCQLQHSKRGRGDDAPIIAENTPLNLHIILSQDFRLAGGVRLNEFDGSTMVRLPGTDELSPVGGTTATGLVIWLEYVYGMRTTEERVGRSLNEAAELDRYHPVRDYLRATKWDGVPRTRRLLSDYLGASDTTLHESLSMRWMLTAVARVMKPGCKVDTTLILVGKQGARKSTAIRVLAGEYSADTLLDLGSKDLYESIHGVWLYELAELDSFRKAEWPKIKAILSSPKDRYRRPYSPAAEARDRQCIFIGTTNDAHFLGDPTGSRRFWPVTVGDRVDIPALVRDRDQLWAEAVYLYDQGHEWWLSDDEAADMHEEAENYRSCHPWHDRIEGWLAVQPAHVTMGDVLERAVCKEPGQWHQGDAKIAGEIMRELGWENKAKRIAGKLQRAWVRPKSQT